MGQKRYKYLNLDNIFIFSTQKYIENEIIHIQLSHVLCLIEAQLQEAWKIVISNKFLWITYYLNKILFTKKKKYIYIYC